MCSLEMRKAFGIMIVYIIVLFVVVLFEGHFRNGDGSTFCHFEGKSSFVSGDRGLGKNRKINTSPSVLLIILAINKKICI